MKKITFVFNEGRTKRLEKDPNGPKEFFYTYNLFKQEHSDTEMIEMLPQGNILFSNVFKVIRKITKLPIYSDKLLTINNLKIIFTSDIVIATNQNIGYSLLPFMLIKKIFVKADFYVFSMGILENFNQQKINNFIVKLLIKTSTKLLFISKSEMKYSSKLYPEFISKYLYVPFGIDINFWNCEISQVDKKKILFIGNDSYRDFNFLQNLAEKMNNFKFTFLTNKIQKTSIKNVSIINGSWKGGELTDSEVKKLYQDHYLTVIPLIDSYQPSGQSVALQSISASTPVLITKTIGFWDIESFENNKHILFLDKNNTDYWEKVINELYVDQEKYEEIANQGLNLIKNKFDITKQYIELKKIFNI